MTVLDGHSLNYKETPKFHVFSRFSDSSLW